MYNFTEDIRANIATFFYDFVNFEEAAYDNKGILTQTAIKQSLKLLITRKVFTPDELTKSILQECNVLIPPNCIIEIAGAQP